MKLLSAVSVFLCFLLFSFDNIIIIPAQSSLNTTVFPAAGNLIYYFEKNIPRLRKDFYRLVKKEVSHKKLLLQKK